MVIDELRPKYRLKVLLQVSGLSKSTYSYYHSKKHLDAQKQKDEEDERIYQIILPVFEHHKGRYGYRLIILALATELEENQIDSKQAKQAKQEIYRLIQPIIDIQPEPDINIQWIFNYYYKKLDNFHKECVN